MRQRTCDCGHTRSHPEVAQDPEYTLWGWIQLSMLGITPRPDRIVFRCRRCEKTLGISRDPELLKNRAVTDKPTGNLVPPDRPSTGPNPQKVRDAKTAAPDAAVKEAEEPRL